MAHVIGWHDNSDQCLDTHGIHGTAWSASDHKRLAMSHGKEMHMSYRPLAPLPYVPPLTLLPVPSSSESQPWAHLSFSARPDTAPSEPERLACPVSASCGLTWQHEQRARVSRQRAHFAARSLFLPCSPAGSRPAPLYERTREQRRRLVRHLQMRYELLNMMRGQAAARVRVGEGGGWCTCEGGAEGRAELHVIAHTHVHMHISRAVASKARPRQQ